MRKRLMLGLLSALVLGVVAIQAQAPAPSAIKRNVMVKADMAVVYVIEQGKPAAIPAPAK
jgi:hypothetical protein